MKILLLPVWILSLCIAFFGVQIATQGTDGFKLTVSGVVFLGLVLPPLAMFAAWQRERERRIEIEQRWKKELQKQNESY